MINPELAALEQLLAMASEEDRRNLQEVIKAEFGSSPKLLCDHFNFLHGGFAGQLWNRSSWKQLVTDVADHIKIDWSPLLRGRHWDDLPAAEIEDAVVVTVVGKIVQNLSNEDRKRLARELGTAFDDPDIIPELLAGGGMLFARLSGIQIYLLATTALGAITAGLGITLPFAIYAAMTTTIGVILGPIGWTALAISALFSLSQANYAKLLPGVIYVSYIRHKLDQGN